MLASTATGSDGGRSLLQTMPNLGEDNRLPTPAKVRAFLESAAKRRILFTYQELAKALDILPPHSIHQVTEALERLMEEDAAADRPFIAALAISRTRGSLPAPGSSTARDVSAGSRTVRTQGRFTLAGAVRAATSDILFTELTRP